MGDALRVTRENPGIIHLTNRWSYQKIKDKYEDVSAIEFSRAIFPVFQRVRLMAMLQAFFDAGGTHKGSLAVGIAGYISSDKRWGQFQRDWRQVIQRFQIPFFHMTDWENRQRVFDGWSEVRRHELYGELVKIIRRTFIVGVSAFTIVSDYREYLKDEGKKLSPITFCFIQCLGLIEQWANEKKQKNPIAYVLESGDRIGPELARLEYTIRKNPDARSRFRFGPLSFESKQNLSPLQASDIFAYENYKEMCNYLVPRQETREVRMTAKILFDRHSFNGANARYYAVYLDSVALKSGKAKTSEEEWRKLQDKIPPRDAILP